MQPVRPDNPQSQEGSDPYVPPTREQQQWYSPSQRGDLFIPTSSGSAGSYLQGPYPPMLYSRQPSQYQPYLAPAPSPAPSPAPMLLPSHAPLSAPKKAPASFNPPKHTIGAVRSGNWSDHERDRLLEWLGKDASNYKSYKINMKRTLERISVEVFAKQRTVDSIRTQWDSMKKKYQLARDKLQATGEGQQDDTEKWTSIKLSWLNKLCPYFDQIDEILQKDKAITPPYASESGGTVHIEEKETQNTLHLSETFIGLDDEDLDSILNGNEELGENDLDSLHPPAGGQKTPKRKNDSNGQSITRGFKGLKRQKPNMAQEITERLHKDKMDLEERRLEMERLRDDRQFKLSLEREKTIRERDQLRHSDNSQRMRLAELRMKVQLATLLRGENGKQLASIIDTLGGVGQDDENENL